MLSTPRKAQIWVISPQLLTNWIIDGAATDHCKNQGPWQKTALAAPGVAADLFWQLGVTLSTGPTHDDTFTIYDGSADWECLVTDHVAAIG